MNKRQILYLVLSFVVTMVVLLGVALTVLLLDKPQVKVVWTKGTEPAKAAKKVKRGKWEGKEKQAIKMVMDLEVLAPLTEEDKKKRRKKNEEPEKIAMAKLVKDGFFEQKFGLADFEGVGWRAFFLKQSYYFVSYQRADGLVNMGPTWLVDVKKRKILPKNAMARAAMNPQQINPKGHFERERQIIGSIANHSFPSGVKLGGIMLIHFATLESQIEDDRIVGWTIVHDYGNNYRAYFQWIENGEATYADFEYDFSKRALRGRNLQAANFMNLGRDFEISSENKVAILPKSYDSKAERLKDRWTGPAKKQCRSKDHRRQCNAMATVLQDAAQIEAVEWLLTVLAEDPQAFEACQNARRCKWFATTDDDNLFKIEYLYDLDMKGEEKVAWEVDLKKRQIIPKNKISEMAFLAVHPKQRSSSPAPK